MDRRAAVAGVAAAPCALAALLLLGCAGTFEGRLAAGCALLALALAPARRSRRGLAVVAPALLAGGLLLVLRAPSGEPAEGARLRARYLLGGGASRLAPTNLVPEGDQLVLATHLVWLLDPVMTRASAARLRGAIRGVYASAERDPEARALGSALGDAILDRDTGRVYLYEPPHAPGERRPVVLFLHGSAGSWKGYLQVLLELARRRGLGLAQPSFGFGAWNRPGGVDAVERTRRWLVAQPWVDPSRVYLVGLSNGGRGITRVMQSGPARFRGLVFVSAVVEPRVLDAAPLEPSWRAVPALVVHGARDDRVPLAYMDLGVDALRAQGVPVRYAVFPEEDHYLIFTAPERLRAEVGAWLDLVEAGGLPGDARGAPSRGSAAGVEGSDGRGDAERRPGGVALGEEEIDRVHRAARHAQ